MIINWICGMAETSAEVILATSFFVELCGREKVRGICGSVSSALLAFVYFTIGFRVYSVMLQALDVRIFILLPLMAVELTGLMRKEALTALAWSLFVNGTALVIRMPIVLLCSIKYQLDYMECVMSSYVWSRMGILFIYSVLSFICLTYRRNIISFLKQIPFRNIIFMIIGFIEIAIVNYGANSGLKTEDDRGTVLTGTALMLFLFFVSVGVGLVILLEYQEIAKANHLLHSNELKMKLNYDMLRDEIARNYKAAHDRRHDMEYIYQCMKEQDYGKGLKYIEKISAIDENINRSSTWTGYGTVDYLINKAVCRCRENQVQVISDIEFTVIPIEEYDFFALLANLLDNAIEAALKCEGEKRYIEFNLKSFYNNFSLYISNGYRDEPKRDGEKFISDNATDQKHGWGVECVRDVVKKYDGVMDIAYHDGKFIVDIIFIG